MPYSVLKLLRLLRYMELPGESWAGWHFSRGHLVTPEGRTLSGKDGSWWSLLVRQAQGFGQLYREAQMAAIERSHLVSLTDENTDQGPKARGEGEARPRPVPEPELGTPRVTRG